MEEAGVLFGQVMFFGMFEMGLGIRKVEKGQEKGRGVCDLNVYEISSHIEL